MKMQIAEELQGLCPIRKRVKQGQEDLVQIVFWNDIKKEDGSFTVEAAFLIPLFCFFIFALMMISLYFCDMNVTQSFLEERVWELSRGEKTYSAEDAKRDRDYLEEQMLVADLNKFALNRSMGTIKGEAEISMALSFPVVSQWMGELWSNQFAVSIDGEKTIDFIRRWK